jgi:hypothetical protein
LFCFSLFFGRSPFFGFITFFVTRLSVLCHPGPSPPLRQRQAPLQAPLDSATAALPPPLAPWASGFRSRSNTHAQRLATRIKSCPDRSPSRWLVGGVPARAVNNAERPRRAKYPIGDRARGARIGPRGDGKKETYVRACFFCKKSPKKCPILFWCF